MRGHIRKRGSKWVVIVDVGPDQNGRRKQRWHSGFYTKRDASRALTEILGRLQLGAYVEPSRQTLADFLREWLPAVQVTLRPSTFASYRANVETHIIPHLGTIPLQNLTPATLNGFYAELLQGARTGRGRGLKATTVHYIHVILHKSLAQAVRWDRLSRNPADQADPPRRQADTQMRTWSAEELRAFLEHVRDDRLYHAYLVAATTGLRRGEVLGLRWADVDLDAGRLAIRQTLILVRNELAFSTPKTAKGRRSVALDPVTADALRTYRRTQLEERLAWGPAYQDNDLVFCREDGAPIHPQRFYERFDQQVRAAGLPRIRLHDLRHTHATLALQAGVHPKVVSERLGHSSVAITLDTYSHVVPAMEEEAAAKVAAVVFG